MKTRIVVTGMGAVTPLGIGVRQFWENLVAGKTGVDAITLFDSSSLPCHIGAEVRDFCATDFMTPKLARETDRFIQFALASVQQTLEESSLDLQREDPYRIGIVYGTTAGGVITISEGLEKIRSNGRSRIGPHFMSKMLHNIAAAQIGIRHGFRGPSLTISTACATGADAVGTAMSFLRAGEADVMVAGGSESLYCQLMFAGLCSARAMSTRNEDPPGASRPFDSGRDGMVMGEGGGAVVLETLDHARERGARILAEIVGYANCGDGFHTMAPQPEGNGEAHCMQRALASAGLAPSQIDYINAHGTSTPLGDRVETLAIRKVFGPGAYAIPVSSTKGATGHMIAAAGVIELIASIQAIREGLVPPTINQTEPDPECDLDYVPNQPRRMPVQTVMSNSFGFGGQNACLIARKFEG